MLDDLLFQRGSLLTQIGDQCDDYDSLIPDYYFKHTLGLKGEVIDTNGSEYNLGRLVGADMFTVTFCIYETPFETTDGEIVGFSELIVKCEGSIIQQNGADVLDIKTFTVISVN